MSQVPLPWITLFLFHSLGESIISGGVEQGKTWGSGNQTVWDGGSGRSYTERSSHCYGSVRPLLSFIFQERCGCTGPDLCHWHWGNHTLVGHSSGWEWRSSSWQSLGSPRTTSRSAETSFFSIWTWNNFNILLSSIVTEDIYKMSRQYHVYAILKHRAILKVKCVFLLLSISVFLVSLTLIWLEVLLKDSKDFNFQRLTGFPNHPHTNEGREQLSEPGSLLFMSWNICSLIPETLPKFSHITASLGQELICDSRKNKNGHYE